MNAVISNSGLGAALIDNINYNAMTKKRIYLDIPYEYRKEAKESGAKWDMFKKLWYADTFTNMDLLKKWLPQINEIRKTPDEEFAEKLKDIGFIFDGVYPKFDNSKHRSAVLGDKAGEFSGFYMAFTNDGRCGGYGKNHRTGEEIRWFEKSSVYYSAPDRAIFREQIEEKRREGKEKEEELHNKTANSVNFLLKSKFKQIALPMKYHEAKKIPITADTFTDEEGKIIAVPHYDIGGKIWMMSYILENGEKRFSKDGKKIGCFHVTNGFENLAALPKIIIAEGYATAVTLANVLGFSVVVAFDHGNILPVAEALRNKFPDKEIIIAGDDDRHLLKIQHSNVGREKAIAAAEIVNGKACFPVFAEDEMEAEGKNFSDWNDLLVNSKLGQDAFLKQVNKAFG